MKYLLIFFLFGCSSNNEIEQEPQSKALKVKEATIGGVGVYYLKLEHAECYGMYNGGMHCKWKGDKNGYQKKK